MTRSRAIFAFAAFAAFLLFSAGPAAAQDPTVTVDPAEDLADGDTLTATVSGFPANGDSFLSGQCVSPIEDPLQQCDTANVVPVPLDADGAATYEITVHTGPIGTGECGPDGDQCVIMVGSLTEPEFAFAPISFASEPVAELAQTGPSQIALTLTTAIVLVALGALLVTQSHRATRRA
jgi:hypothetical protein